jgi:TonB family protein
VNAALLLDNVLAWSAQVTVLVSIGALAALTLSHPRARLIFWQGVLAIALLLPAMEPWHQPALQDPGVTAVPAVAAPVVVVQRPGFRIPWKRQYLLVVLAAGAALRFLWIGAGLLRLRRHRLDARMMTIPPVPFANPRVRWFVSATVGGPVTFGILNPSILLPVRVNELPDDLREAIAHHELAHVRRRDWLFVLFEEAVRSLLWFHPAIWFVLSRIQLSREQVVDAEVVSLTRDRERYLDALVAVAAQRLLPDVAPAPLFLKKRQLAVRVATVLKETRMSKPRMFLSVTTVCSAALVAVRLAVWMFPMQAPAQTRTVERTSAVADGPGVVVEPGAKILHRSPVFFPSGVTTTGTVVVESSVSAKGEVTDARVVSGPEELRNAALSSILNWHFSPDGLPPTVQTSIRFETAPRASAASTVRASAPPVQSNLTVRVIDMSELSDELADKVRASLPVRVGDQFSNEDLARVRAALKEVDGHLTIAIRTNAPDAFLTIMLRPSELRGVVGVPGLLMQEGRVVSTPAPADFPAAADGMQRIRVGGNVESNNLTRKVTPLYPPLAKQARIQGTVRFNALIGADGSVLSLQLVEGHPLLVPSAQQAVSQWLYKPTLLNGTAVEVVTQIDVNYTLSQ